MNKLLELWINVTKEKEIEEYPKEVEKLYNYTIDLQQRIDKAIDELNGYCPCDDNEIYERTEKVLSILQGEEVK